MLRAWFTSDIAGNITRAAASLRLTISETLDARRFLGVADVGADEFGELYDRAWHGELDADVRPLGAVGNPEEGESAPCPPPSPELMQPWRSRRGRAFYQYWVARLYEKYPNVIHDHSPSALACSRKWLAEEMRKPRTVNGVERHGMHTWQIVSCVDAIVAVAHAGTNYRWRTYTILNESKPTWLERLFGVHRRGAGF